MPTPDDVLAALDELEAALAANDADAARIRARAAAIRAGLAGGASVRDVVETADRPLIVEVLSDQLDRLFRAGGRLRRAEAAALHAEGLSMEAIAGVFGVTRQRVSALLKPVRDAAGAGRR